MKNSPFIGHFPPPKNPFEPIVEESDYSPILGIFEGKRKKAKAAAKIAEINAQKEKELALEESKRLSFQQQATAYAAGYNPVQQAADASVAIEKTKQTADTNLYLVIGGIVIAVMVGLYFIKRKS